MGGDGGEEGEKGREGKDKVGKHGSGVKSARLRTSYCRRGTHAGHTPTLPVPPLIHVAAAASFHFSLCLLCSRILFLPLDVSFNSSQRGKHYSREKHCDPGGQQRDNKRTTYLEPNQTDHRGSCRVLVPRSFASWLYTRLRLPYSTRIWSKNLQI